MIAGHRTRIACGRMVRFLSAAWLDEMTSAAGLVSGFAPADGVAPSLSVRQVVTGGPDGDVIYDLLLDAQGVTVRRPGATAPDVAFEQDYDTARRLARGEAHPQVELAAGRLRITGAANRLTSWGPLLDALDEALAELRATTSW